MIALEAEQSLRFESGCRVRIICLFGCLWVTTEGDPVDHFLQRGESIAITGARLSLVSAWEPAVVKVQALAPGHSSPNWSSPLKWNSWRWPLRRRACCLP